MEICVSKIGDEPFAWSERRKIDAALLERQQLLQLGEIRWGGTVTRVQSGFLFEAELGYEQELECPRCLHGAKMPVQSEVILVVQTEPAENVEEQERELDGEELNVLYLDSDLLDTEPILHEQLQLNIPMRRLCREDCAGLCPSCGVDRNKNDCDCSEKEIDPRWQALAALRSDKA